MEQQVLPCTAPRSVIIIQLYSPNRQQNEKEKKHITLFSNLAVENRKTLN